jgi:serine/threonine protein kinase/WD40 repeat protein
VNEADPLEEVIFNAARQFADTDKRRQYLDLACEGNSDLRQRVERLLRTSGDADAFFGRNAAFAAQVVAPVLGTPPPTPVAEQPGTRIGRYKLLEQIGEGAFGSVFMAEQEEPVRRRVALKLIKLGMDTKQVVARFEAERQALALMDHPNIAKVLDGGATETGSPFFVMELVQGVPITEFCDKNQLSLEQRLELFIPVCQAIQSAHQKGIIHRDLKPTNILVTLNPDGSGFPKVIDFGVAKATSQKLTEKTLFTAHGMMVGTPAYMSPEQAEMSQLDVDTRADIYSLGALLYELLTGSPPFPEQRLRSAGYNEMQRIILEEQPERPSTRLSTLQGQQRSIVARNRRANEVTLGRGFPGDLDWIVMKCLEKDRARRYETANGLARDIERHLNNEPVVARPPSRLYELQKTVRRHWVGFTAVAAVVTALSVGVAVSTWQAIRARRAESAETHLRTSAQQAEAEQAKQKTAAQQSLYKYLLGEARATRTARRTGYRNQVFALLKQANALDVPERKPAELRSEAVACMGDFVGLQPAVLPGFLTNIYIYGACLAPSGKLAAFVMATYRIKPDEELGPLELRELPSGAEVARFDVAYRRFQDLCFNSTGDELVAKFGPPLARFVVWAPDAAGHWRETRQIPYKGGPVYGLSTKLVRLGTNVFSVHFSSTNNLAIRMPWVLEGRDVGFELSPDDYDAPEKCYVTFRLLDFQHDSFAPGYAVTTAVPQNGQMTFCVTADARILAVETREGQSPNAPVLVSLYDWQLGENIGQFQRTTTGALWSSPPLRLSEDGNYFINLTEVGGSVYTIPGLERLVQFKQPFFGGLRPLIFGNLVAVPEQNQIRLWNVVKKQEAALLEQPEDPWPVAASADGNYLLTAGDFNARLYRLNPPERLELPAHAGGVSGIAFSPDGLRLASVSKDHVLRVCDALTGRMLWETNDLLGPAQAVSFSPDGQLLAVGHWDSDRVWIRDADAGKRLLPVGEGREGRGLSAQFSPDGRYLATVADMADGVKIWRIERNKSGEADDSLEVSLVKSWGTGMSLEFAPDSHSVAFCSSFEHKAGSWNLWGRSNCVYVWDFETSAEPRRLDFTLFGGIGWGGFTPDGHQLIALGTNGDIVKLDVATGERISSVHIEDRRVLDGPQKAIRLSPDSSKLAVSVRETSESGVSLLHPKTGKMFYSLPFEPGTIWGLLWSPDGRRLVVGRDNGNMAIWDLEKVEQTLAQLGLNP